MYAWIITFARNRIKLKCSILPYPQASDRPVLWLAYYDRSRSQYRWNSVLRKHRIFCCSWSSRQWYAANVGALPLRFHLRISVSVALGLMYWSIMYSWFPSSMIALGIPIISFSRLIPSGPRSTTSPICTAHLPKKIESSPASHKNLLHGYRT